MNDTVVDHDPFGIATARGSRSDKVVAHAEHVDNGEEEASPLGVVAGMEVEGDRNVMPDVNGLQDRGRKSAGREQRRRGHGGQRRARGRGVRQSKGRRRARGRSGRIVVRGVRGG